MWEKIWSDCSFLSGYAEGYDILGGHQENFKYFCKKNMTQPVDYYAMRKHCLKCGY